MQDILIMLRLKVRRLPIHQYDASSKESNTHGSFEDCALDRMLLHQQIRPFLRFSLGPDLAIQADLERLLVRHNLSPQLTGIITIGNRESQRLPECPVFWSTP